MIAYLWAFADAAARIAGDDVAEQALNAAFKSTPEMRARLAKVHQRGNDGKLTVTAFEVPQDPEFEPGGGGIYSTAGDYRITLFYAGFLFVPAACFALLLPRLRD